MLINRDVTLLDYDELEQLDKIKIKRSPMRSRKLGWDNNYYKHGAEIYGKMNRFMRGSVGKLYNQVYSDFCKKFKPWECGVNTRNYFKLYFQGPWGREPSLVVDDTNYVHYNTYKSTKHQTKIPKEVVETTYMEYQRDAEKYGIDDYVLSNIFGRTYAFKFWWLHEKIHVERYNNIIYTENTDRCLKPIMDNYRNIHKLPVKYFSDNEVKQRLLKKMFKPDGYILYDVLNYNDYRARKYRKERRDQIKRNKRIANKIKNEFWTNYNFSENSSHIKSKFIKHGMLINLPHGLEGDIMIVDGEEINVSPNTIKNIISNTYSKNHLLNNLINSIK